MAVCEHVACNEILDLRPSFHMNFRGPFRKFLRGRGFLTALEGEIGFFSAWWPQRGSRSELPPSELDENHRGIVEFLRPGACNILTDKKRLAGYLEEASLSSWAPLTVLSPSELPSHDDALWFLKHALEDDNAGVTVHLGSTACREAWCALPEDEQSKYVAQKEVLRPFLDPVRRKITFRVFILVGVIPLSPGGGGTAWCLAYRRISCRSHPMPYDAHIADAQRHVHSSLGKIRGVTSLAANEVFTEDVLEEKIWPKITEMLRDCVHPILEKLLRSEEVGSRGEGRLSFDLLGADFLLDEFLQPWILEFNQKPNLMASPWDPATTCNREALVNDLLALVVDSVRAAGCVHHCIHGDRAWESIVQHTVDLTAEGNHR